MPLSKIMSAFDIRHVAAFSDGDRGGNPAGVVLADSLPPSIEMQDIAREVGYSETVFAAGADDCWTVRYFSPDAEIPFCGHATIALAACLAKHHGSRRFRFKLANASVEVEGEIVDGRAQAAFLSPPSSTAPVAREPLEQALALFGMSRDDLDDRLQPAHIDAGARHLLLPVGSRDILRRMSYAFEQGRTLMRDAGWVTVMMCFAQSPRLFHVRNAFAYGGVYEDPATGAAAAALAGHLRHIGYAAGERITIHQGDDMGLPCRIHAITPPWAGSGVQVSGTARFFDPGPRR